VTDEKKKAMDLEFERLDRNADATRRRLEYLEEVYAKSGGDSREVQKTLDRWRSLDEARSLYEKEIQAALVEARAQRALEISPTSAELAEAHEKVYDLAAFRNKKKSVIVPSFDPGWDTRLTAGMRFKSEGADGGWFPSKGNDKIKARGDRHRADFTWVGAGLEAERVMLFVDGIRIEEVKPDLDAGANSMVLFFVLPDHVGKEVPLVRAETCIEDDGSVRIQLWTEK